MSSAVVAMQMRSLEQQSLEEQLDRRAADARTYGALGLARVQDLFNAGYLVKHCQRGRELVMVKPDLEREKHRAISRIWDTGAQIARLEYCDFDALSASDRASLYAPNGSDPRNCKKVPVVISVGVNDCGKPMVATAFANVSKKELLLGEARQSARLMAEVTGGTAPAKAPSAPPKKGCPFACHTGPDGRQVKGPAGDKAP